MSKKYIIAGAVLAVIMAAWLALGSDTSESASIFVEPQSGPFEVTVINTGELRAKNSTEIKGPEGLRDIRLYNTKIQKLIPEGTVVEKGDFVAELDRSEIMTKMQDAQLELQQAESQYEQAQLDSSLTLSQARDNLVNMQYTLEERQIAVEQSQYESPAVQRQATIDLEKAQRQLKQGNKNYKTKVKQAEAKLREIEVDLTKAKNSLANIRQIMGQFRINAPEDGMVIYKRDRSGRKQVEGSSVSAWNPVVAELPDFTAFESVTYVNEVDIQNVQNKQHVDLSLDAYPEKELNGTVVNVANIGEQRPNSDSKVFEVIIEINKPDTTLRPAMTTSNTIHINSLDKAMYVPLETIHSVDSLSYIFKRDGLQPVMQQVELGMMNENNVVINTGISMDDTIYMTLPEDTTGVEKIMLDKQITSK
jgi:multidrug efflux pump subunit AcrA (membrane-fusion protein)